MVPKSKPTDLEIQVFKYIIKDLATELEILNNTLRPDYPLKFFYDCPSLRIPAHEEDVWKIQIHSRKIQDILNLTWEELQSSKSYELLKEASKICNKTFEEYEEEKNIEMSNRLKIANLKADLKKVTTSLRDSKNTIIMTHLRESLNNEINTLERRSGNKLAYCKNFSEKRFENQRQLMELNEGEIRKQILMLQAKTDVETRCSREMQAYLTYHRNELADELNRCMATHERWRTEGDETAMAMRMRTDQFTEQAERLEEIYERRGREIAEYRELRNKVKETDEATLVIQTWWRAVMVTKEEELLKNPKSKKKGEKKVKK